MKKVKSIGSIFKDNKLKVRFTAVPLLSVGLLEARDRAKIYSDKEKILQSLNFVPAMSSRTREAF